jgi:hypothetical protein
MKPNFRIRGSKLRLAAVCDHYSGSASLERGTV